MQAFTSGLLRNGRKPQLDEEEYLKYLMFISEAVQSKREDTDDSTHVPQLSALISRARDPTIRPYYQRNRDGGRQNCGELPPIASGRQILVSLPVVEHSAVVEFTRLS